MASEIRERYKPRKIARPKLVGLLQLAARHQIGTSSFRSALAFKGDAHLGLHLINYSKRAA
jgi:hypothetical protein